MDYKRKYLLYKKRYLNLKGGSGLDRIPTNTENFERDNLNEAYLRNEYPLANQRITDAISDTDSYQNRDRLYQDHHHTLAAEETGLLRDIGHPNSMGTDPDSFLPNAPLYLRGITNNPNSALTEAQLHYKQNKLNLLRHLTAKKREERLQKLGDLRLRRPDHFSSYEERHSPHIQDIVIPVSASHRRNRTSSTVIPKGVYENISGMVGHYGK